MIPKITKILSSRPLACFSLGLISGIALEPKGFGVWALGLGIVLILAAWFFLSRRAGAALPSLLLLTAGVLLGGWRVQGFLETRLAPLPGRIPAASIEGLVREDQGISLEDGRASLVLENTAVTDLQSTGHADSAWPGLVKLTYEASKSSGLFKPGDRISCVGSLRPCLGPTNPGEFDYRDFLLGRGITALVSARFGTGPALVSKGAGFNPARLAWELRGRLVRGLRACLGLKAAGLVAGVVFGDKKGIPHRQIEAYARSGLSYLLAVAGLHLGIALGLFLALVRLLTPSRRKQAILALGLMLAYALVTGLQIPVMRAGALFTLVLAARAFDLETDFLTSLSAGACLILLWQPAALWEAGFQFSFLVTLSVVYVAKVLVPGPGTREGVTLKQRAWERLKEYMAVILAVQLATIPLEAWHFHQFTWTVFFSNFMAVILLPLLIGFGLACAGLAALWPPLAWLPARILEGLAGLLQAGTDFFTRLPHAAVSLGRPPVAWMLAWLAFGLLVAVLLYYARSLRPAPDALNLPRIVDRKTTRKLQIFYGLTGVTCLVLLAWLLWPAMPWSHKHPGVTKAWFLDVGQGDSILVEFEDGKTLLVDGGPGMPDAGSWVVQPALRSLAISSLDWVLMTHPDADHIGGLEWIFEQIPVGMVLDRQAGEFSNDPEAEAWDGSLLKSVRGLMRTRRMACRLLAAGQPLPGELRGRLKVLWPPSGWKEAARKARNNSSLVVDVGGWLLLAADLEKGGEKALLKTGAIRHGYDLLKLGHHGSRGASGSQFLRAVAPRAVVVMAGRSNRFGFPHKEVLARLAKLNPLPALFRTDLQGCLAFEKEPDGVMAIPFLTADPEALWQAPPKPPRSLWKPLEKAGLVEAVKK